jgi:hypothetical protein
MQQHIHFGPRGPRLVLPIKLLTSERWACISIEDALNLSETSSEGDTVTWRSCWRLSKESIDRSRRLKVIRLETVLATLLRVEWWLVVIDLHISNTDEPHCWSDGICTKYCAEMKGYRKYGLIKFIESWFSYVTFANTTNCWRWFPLCATSDKRCEKGSHQKIINSCFTLQRYIVMGSVIAFSRNQHCPTKRTI